MDSAVTGAGGTGGADTDAVTFGFDATDPAFLSDPYPVPRRLRKVGRAVPYGQRGTWLLTRFDDVHAALRHRSLGRILTHRYPPTPSDQHADPPAYPRWAESERWSLLNREPPEHTRLRRLMRWRSCAPSSSDERPTWNSLGRRNFRLRSSSAACARFPCVADRTSHGTRSRRRSRCRKGQ